MSAATECAKLAKIAQINPTLGTKLAPDDTVSFVPMASLSAETARVESTTDRPYGEVSKGYTAFASGDILVAKITPCFENGKIAQAVLPRPHGFGSTEFHVIRPIKGVSDGRYLHHFLRLDRVRTEGQRRMTGSGGQRRVPANYLAEVEVPLPPLPEQRRIAAILDQADTLRTQRRAALAQLDSLTQSLFLDMFGDPVTNPKAWAVRPLSTLGKVVTGNTPSRDVPEFYGNAIEWIKSDNVNTPHYYLTEAREGLSEAGKAVGRVVPAGSILVTCIAGSPECIGNAAMADREVAFNQQINAFIPNELDPHFAYAQIVVGKKLIQSASTNGMKGMVSKSRLESIELITPPLPLQQTFATRIQAIEALKAQHRAALAEADALFAALQQRAFAGGL